MDHSTKLLSPGQIRQADAYTIAHEPVLSIELMERAAGACVKWITSHFERQHVFHVFCGLGNNGGDGLAIARLLKYVDYTVKVYIIRYAEKMSDDFLANEIRLKRIHEDVTDIETAEEFPEIRKEDVIIDALFGTGLSKPLSGLHAECVRRINLSKAKVLAIDMPSGLFANQHSDKYSAVVNADYTLSFQCPKIAFMFPENGVRVGKWEILDIGLSGAFIEQLETKECLLTQKSIAELMKPREKFSHKGNYGHALLVAGKYSTMGAAILATKACLRSGVGRLTMHSPSRGVAIMQIAVPEAMISVDKHHEIFSDAPNSLAYSAVGIGPGIGTSLSTHKAVYDLIQQRHHAMVLDADALNILSLKKTYHQNLPPHAVLTPHPKEFERLTRIASNDFERHEIQLEFSRKHSVYILLKGAHSCLTTPKGLSFFNSTGNPGMAKGGSGDVLTGVITALLAQGHTPLNAALIGMYCHGLAGDIAMQKHGVIGMTAGDIVDCLPLAFDTVLKAV